MNGKKAKTLRKVAEILHDKFPNKPLRRLYQKLKVDYKAGRLKL